MPAGFPRCRWQWSITWQGSIVGIRGGRMSFTTPTWSPRLARIPRLDPHRLTRRCGDACRRRDYFRRSGEGLEARTGRCIRALKQRRDVTVAHLDRPQSKMADFYRELADAFPVSVGASNRWGGFRMLRERCRSSIESKLLRPVLLIDEAQEIPEAVMSEIRILTSDDFDSRSLLTVVFAGDSRLQANLATPEMLPIESRLRVKVTLQAQATPELTRAMQELCAKAGNPNLMTPGLMPTLADHAHGNFRSLMHIANELLAEAYERKADKIDEKLYMEVMSSRTPATQRSSEGRRKTASLRG